MPAKRALTPALVEAAFRKIKPGSLSLEVQPANGITAVNLPTNFFTEPRTLDRTVHLLGRRVSLHITSTSYTWHFGDGQSTTTTTPGAAYPHLIVTHRYPQTGSVHPSLTTTYTASYHVDGGPYRPVPGTVTATGPTQDLQVNAYRPQLVNYR